MSALWLAFFLVACCVVGFVSCGFEDAGRVIDEGRRMPGGRDE